jgi:hypothetical protein
MLIKNSLDKTFGPVGSSAGILLFVAGIAIIFFSFSGLIFIIAGAFIGFTSTSTTIDYDKNRIRFCDKIFGIIKIGKWITIDKNMKIGIIKSNIGWVSYNVNIPRDFVNKDYRVILYNSNNRQIMPIEKFKSIDAARLGLEQLAVKLRLTVI